MGAVAWALSGFSILLALVLALVTYVTALVVLRALSPDEWRLLAPLLPLRLRRLAPS
jgi:hypothetical protein